MGGKIVILFHLQAMASHEEFFFNLEALSSLPNEANYAHVSNLPFHLSSHAFK